MTESLSQSSVVHITSLWGVPPLAQLNGQLGHYSQLTVSTDAPMAWHMGIHAHAHTHTPLAQYTFWCDNAYISQKMGWCQTFMSVHVSVGMVTCMFCILCWLEFNWATGASGQNSTTQPKRNSGRVRWGNIHWGVYLSSLCRMSKPRYHLTVWAITNISWASSWSGADIHLLSSRLFISPHNNHRIMLISCGSYWDSG